MAGQQHPLQRSPGSRLHLLRRAQSQHPGNAARRRFPSILILITGCPLFSARRQYAKFVGHPFSLVTHLIDRFISSSPFCLLATSLSRFPPDPTLDDFFSQAPLKPFLAFLTRVRTLRDVLLHGLDWC